MAEGNRDKTQPSCNSSVGGKCNCQPSYRVRVWIPEDGARRTRTFTGKGALSAAKNWRTDASKAVKDGKLRASTRQTLREAVDEFLEGAEAGAIRKRGGGTYKPAVIRNYRSALNRHVLPKLGDRRLDSITTSSCGRIWSCRPPGRPTDPRPAGGRDGYRVAFRWRPAAMGLRVLQRRSSRRTQSPPGGERPQELHRHSARMGRHSRRAGTQEQGRRSAYPAHRTLRPYLDAQIRRTGRSGTDLLSWQDRNGSVRAARSLRPGGRGVEGLGAVDAERGAGELPKRG